MLKILLSFFLMTCLFAEEKIVNLVTNFGVNPDVISELLQQNGVKVKVVLSDLTEYGPDLVKNRSRWGRIVRKFGLDFPHHISLPDEVTKIIFFNSSVRYWRNLALHKLPKEKLVLFLWEPPTLLPKMYSKSFHDKFGKIYTWDDSLVDNVKYFKINYPCYRPMISELVPFEEKKLCTLLATHFSPKHPGSLYGERVKAIQFFEEVGESGFEFYGKQWDPAMFRNYRGEAADKIDTIKNYRFSICYENTEGLQGYITEKIFDCFAAGNVPIYWGASNITNYIPKECFIDRRDFASMKDLHTYIKNMGREDYENYIQHIRAFLLSDQAKIFSREMYAKALIEAVTD